MRNVARGSTALSAIAAMVSVGGAAQAMEIQQFDRMAFADQKEYVIELVEGAQKVLRDEGRGDLAEKVGRLFTTKDSQGKISIGMGQLEIAIARARVVDARNVDKDPQAARLEVEDAMAVVMEYSGIELPPSFMLRDGRLQTQASIEGRIGRRGSHAQRCSWVDRSLCDRCHGVRQRCGAGDGDSAVRQDGGCEIRTSTIAELVQGARACLE